MLPASITLTNTRATARAALIRIIEMSNLVSNPEPDDIEIIPDEDIEICWEPNKYDDKLVWEKLDGSMRIETVQQKDERLKWDDDKEKYVKVSKDAFAEAEEMFKQAMRGEQKAPRPKRPRKIFIPDTGDIEAELNKQLKEELDEMLRKWFR
jgi:hypothetical protein